jgi:teichuronic acid biosynthesis glycosyltransferase TuaG
MRDGLVSVITPAYNCAQYIGKTIESVQAQTYDNWEMVIVDDCSTDNTQEVVESYSKDDPRVHYICLNENSGAAVARTESMKAAQGEFMAFLDSDDMWKPEKLAKQLAFMRKEGHPFSCTAYEQVDEQGNPLGKVIKTIRQTSYNRLLLDCPVGNSTVMYSVRKMGKFEVPNIRKRNDDALWLQMLKKEPYIWGMPDILAEYRVREGSISHNKFDLLKYHWKLYRDIEHLGVLRSIFHIVLWGFIKLFKIK